MTDLTPTFAELLHKRDSSLSLSTRPLTTETADEFLKEAYRINTHISSLLSYLHKIRPSYLSINTTSARKPNPNFKKNNTTHNRNLSTQNEPLSPSELDSITTSTSSLLHTLSTSITNLSAAETLRQNTTSTLLDKKYGRKRSKASNLLFQWASGSSPLAGGSAPTGNQGKREEQIVEEEKEELRKGVREGILWFLRRRLEGTIEMQRSMVEKRIERAREREMSVLYKSATAATATATATATGSSGADVSISAPSTYPDTGLETTPGPAVGKAAMLDESEVAAIEAELSPEQLQLFAEENDSMVRYYEDTLSKVQNAEKSLLEISSLQQTLVSHLSIQEDYIGQLVTDVSNTEANIGRGNKELKRATERRSAAQAVFWGTVGLCTWLVVWDLIF